MKEANIHTLVKSFLNRRGDKRFKALLLHQPLSRKHEVYFQLVDELQQLFPTIHKSHFERLAFVHGCYFQGMLLLDASLYGDVRDNAKSLLTAIELFEAALKELCWMFGRSSTFWNQYRQLKQRYDRAVAMEKTLSALPALNDVAFADLYEAKSACLSYNLIYALVQLSDVDDHPIVEPLIELLKHLHLAHQYNDDVVGFRGDLAKGRYSYAIHLVATTAGRHVDADFRYKYLFTSGIASVVIDKAKHHFEKALGAAKAFDLSQVCRSIMTDLAACERQLEEMSALIQKTHKK